MLTADLVHARRKKDALEIVPLGARRELALDFAETVIEIARDHVGRSREELEGAWNAIEVEPRDRKLLDGIEKLVEDALLFESDSSGDPVAIRGEVFRRAAELRRALAAGSRLDRGAVLAEIAAARATDPGAIERALYSDLRGAQLLREVHPIAARSLIEGYDLAQAQAVLLRATRVVVALRRVDPRALRALLRKLKFLRLLATVQRDEEGWRLELDGPFSLFESVTKYGLALALALPAIVACGEHTVIADVRWGKERVPLRFAWSGARAEDSIEPRLSDDAEALRAKLAGRDDLKVSIADTILDLPGVGACVPDLVVTDRETEKTAYVEVLGYWSRDAVWKRVELVQAGMATPVLFCVGERLRVSEAVLPHDAPSALLVYKGVISAAAAIEKLRALMRLNRSDPRRPSARELP